MTDPRDTLMNELLECKNTAVAYRRVNAELKERLKTEKRGTPAFHALCHEINRLEVQTIVLASRVLDIIAQIEQIDATGVQ